MVFAQAHEIAGTFEDVCKDRKMRVELNRLLEKQGKEAGLMGFEGAKNVWLESKPFSEVGITTNTFKLQRFSAKKHYAKEIE